MENKLEIKNYDKLYLDGEKVFDLPKDPNRGSQFISVVGERMGKKGLELFVADGLTCCSQGNIYHLERNDEDLYVPSQITKNSEMPIEDFLFIGKDRYLAIGNGCNSGVYILSNNEALEVIPEEEYREIRRDMFDSGYTTKNASFWIGRNNSVFLIARRRNRAREEEHVIDVKKERALSFPPYSASHLGVRPLNIDDWLRKSGIKPGDVAQNSGLERCHI